MTTVSLSTGGVSEVSRVVSSDCVCVDIPVERWTIDGAEFAIRWVDDDGA